MASARICSKMQLLFASSSGTEIWPMRFPLRQSQKIQNRITFGLRPQAAQMSRLKPFLCQHPQQYQRSFAFFHGRLFSPNQSSHVWNFSIRSYPGCRRRCNALKQSSGIAHSYQHRPTAPRFGNAEIFHPFSFFQTRRNTRLSMGHLEILITAMCREVLWVSGKKKACKRTYNSILRPVALPT